MRTTLELLSILQIDRFAIYDFTYREKLAVRGLSYRGDKSYSTVVRLTKDAASLMYNENFNVLSLTYVNEPNKPWTNLTIYSIDDSMFRGILHGKHDIDKMWPGIYHFFKSGKITQELFIYYCKTVLNITEFDWN